MRTTLNHLAWGLATVALAIATPVRAAAFERPIAGRAVPTAATPTIARADLSVRANTTIPEANTIAVTTPRAVVNIPTQSETGAGWAELYCVGCVALGTYALYTGGISMLPIILANPEAVGALTGLCLTACRSALEALM